jgi:hypothetical protein
MIFNVRKYNAVQDFLDNSGMKCTSNTSFNLYDVASYEEHVEKNSFNDNISRTRVVFKNNTWINIRCAFSEFDKVMTHFYCEVGLMDDRSIKKKVKDGPIQFYFFNYMPTP